jgi:hypothetical protein
MGAGLVALAGGADRTRRRSNGPSVRCSQAPAWVLLRLLVAIVEASATVPFASVSLPSPV